MRWVVVGWLCCGVMAVAADEPRLIITGWNSPTAAQFARDIGEMQTLPFDGCSIHVRNGGSPSVALRRAFSNEDWSNVSLTEAADILANVHHGRLTGTYLLINANPGNVDWFDDDGWAMVVDHWRRAARLAKQGGLRGLLFDPEPYTKPYRQFSYARQNAADAHTFPEYQRAARQRGHDVMIAIAAEFPDAEILSYFLNSYLVRDHRYRGPSPVAADGSLRRDAEWCLAGHSYGLMPAFLDGWLDAIPPSMTLIDGCENGYWFETRTEFFDHARDVRERGAMLVSESNRATYQRQLKVAFPIFLDSLHTDLVGHWTLRPEITDRLSLLRSQLQNAADAGDGLVWIYSERGRWWPPAKETALWNNKDVYPEWDSVLPGCLNVFREVRQRARRPNVFPELPSTAVSNPDTLGPNLPLRWATWVKPDTPGAVSQDGRVVTIRGARDAAGLAFVDVKPDRSYRITARVSQSGHGLTSLAVRWRDTDRQWVTPGTHDRVAYPADGDPTGERVIQIFVTAPDGPVEMGVALGVKNQFDADDLVTFRDLVIQMVE